MLLTYKTKSVDDISYCYQGIYILGTGMVNMYAIYFGLWAVYIPCLLEFSLIVLLTIMKRAYTGRKDADDAFVENASQPRHISPRLSAGVSSRRLSVEMEDSSLAQTWKSTRDLVSKSTRNLMMKDQVKQSTAELSDVEKDGSIELSRS